MSKESAKDFLDYLKNHPELSKFNEQTQMGEPLSMPDEAAPLLEIEFVQPIEPIVEPVVVEPVMVEPIVLP